MRKWPVIILSVWLLHIPFRAQKPSDSEQLGMALEYFQSAKYHEALLIFEKLDEHYTLNPRYHAYMGVCYYNEWLYQEACQYLDEAIPQLESFSPQERSVYYYTAGESHFQLQQYEAAIPLFEKALTVCHENEKGLIHYRLGMCHMMSREWKVARDHYDAALDNLITYRDTPDMQSRIYQAAHMLKGCETHLPKTLLTMMGSATEMPQAATRQQPMGFGTFSARLGNMADIANSSAESSSITTPSVSTPPSASNRSAAPDHPTEDMAPTVVFNQLLQNVRSAVALNQMLAENMLPPDWPQAQATAATEEPSTSTVEEPTTSTAQRHATTTAQEQLTVIITPADSLPATTKKLPISEARWERDTIKNVIPTTINIEDLFEEKIELRE